MQKVPRDLQKVLVGTPKAKERWQSLTPIARRDFVSWVEGAKQEETRKRRVEKALSMLLSGKRRPCCYAVVPMGIYKALSTNKKAKDVWQALTPDERRDFNDWINEEKEKDKQNKRIEKVCSTLASGKRHL